MKQNEVLLSVHSINKSYRLYDRPEDRLKDLLLSNFGKRYGKEFDALSDINFEVHRGETFGIIGRNGSGKSTLLQLIAGIIKPTSGQIQVKGKVAALLELGSGFNPEFSGRENVFMNGAILGMSREYMEEHYQEIIEFASIGDYIEQPVKFYSSGMFVRLAFAVATSVEADILLIDEALAVGDVFFRQKCYAKLEQLRQEGTAIILVTHAMGEVQEFCQRTLLLHRAKQLYLGDTVKAVSEYYLVNQEASSKPQKPDNSAEIIQKEKIEYADQQIFWPATNAFLPLSNSAEITGGKEAECCTFAMCDSEGLGRQVFLQGETLHVYYEIEVQRDMEIPVGGIVIRNEKNIIVHGKDTMQYNLDIQTINTKNSRIRFHQSFELDISEGEYTIELGFSNIKNKHYTKRSSMRYEELLAHVDQLLRITNVCMFSVRRNKRRGSTELEFHGLCNLQGECNINCVED